MKFISIKEDVGFGVDVDVEFGGFYDFEYNYGDKPGKEGMPPFAKRDVYQAIDEDLSELIKDCRKAQAIARERALRAGRKRK